MDAHENARTTLHSRMPIVDRPAAGWAVAAVATALGISARTVRKWRDRFTAEGEPGLRDRSSRPLRSPTRLCAAAQAQIEALHRQRLSGPAIARRLRRPISSVRVAASELMGPEPSAPAAKWRTGSRNVS